MNTEKLFDAMNEIDEAYKTEALVRNGYLSEAEMESAEMIDAQHLKTTAKFGSKRLLTFALAACLLLALAISFALWII